MGFVFEENRFWTKLNIVSPSANCATALTPVVARANAVRIDREGPVI
jgi:hypothetical protein